jgi:hypothetical protein
MQVTTRPIWAVRNGDSFIAAITGFVLIYLFTGHSGVGVSPDSVTYLSVAAHVHDHVGWIDFHGDPLIDFPAFYPLFLDLVRWVTGMDLLRSAPVVNGLLFAALIYCCGWLMEGFSFRSKIYKWIVLAIIVSSPCLLEIYTMAWSETLFLLLLLLFFYFFRLYLLSRSTRVLVIAGVVAGLSFITRYAGITLIGTGGLLLLCDPGVMGDRYSEAGGPGIPGRQRNKLRQLVVFGLSACLLPVLNLVHNKMAGGTLIGDREKGIVSFGSNLHDLGFVFCDWLHIPNDHYLLASVIGLGWIVWFVLLFALRLVRGKGGQKEAKNPGNAGDRSFSYEDIFVAFFIVYAAFILFSATLSRFQQLDSRLLSPLFIPWLWGSTRLIPEWLASRDAGRRRVFLLPVMLAAAVFLTGQLLADRENWQDSRDSGVPGYTDDDWRRSATMDFVRGDAGMRPPAMLYSNAYDALWFLGAIRADRLPHKDSPREIASLLSKDSFYLVWFNDGLNPDLVDTAFISGYKRLAGRRPFDDGIVYFFTGK